MISSNNVVQENLLGIRVVKSFVREEHEEGEVRQGLPRDLSDFSKAEEASSPSICR
ncbi:MAG: hypothetical protein ACLRWQ_13010 [Flavonifractor plautii]